MRHRAKQKTKGEQCPPFPSRTADYRIYADDIMFILKSSKYFSWLHVVLQAGDSFVYGHPARGIFLFLHAVIDPSAEIFIPKP